MSYSVVFHAIASASTRDTLIACLTRPGVRYRRDHQNESPDGARETIVVDSQLLSAIFHKQPNGEYDIAISVDEAAIPTAIDRLMELTLGQLSGWYKTIYEPIELGSEKWYPVHNEVTYWMFLKINQYVGPAYGVKYPVFIRQKSLDEGEMQYLDFDKLRASLQIFN